MTGQDHKSLRSWAADVLMETRKSLAGLDEVVRLCLVAYCTQGHVLLEGNPGLGKTTLVKVLADAIKLEDGRIQFTPDLMPSDITGTMLPDYQTEGARRWSFDPGPIFASLLLADEINRATPKTQAALLEAMAEGQVTVLGQTYRLPVPFLVLATQNPIDQIGTYALPEAQADRFMFKILMPTPNKESTARILKYNHRILTDSKGRSVSARRALYAACNQRHTGDLSLSEAEVEIQARYRAVLSRFRRQVAEVDNLGIPEDTDEQNNVEMVGLQKHVWQHLINMFLVSNQQYNELEGMSDDQRRRADQIAQKFVYGLGPRAVINLMRAARAWALLFGTASIPDSERIGDAEALAHVLVPILRHRVKLSFDWETLYENAPKPLPGSFMFKGDKVAVLLADFCMSTAPSARENAQYPTLLAQKLAEVYGLEVRRR